MVPYRTIFVTANLALVFAIPAGPANAAANATPVYVAAAVAHPGRPPADRDRDANLKPAETLAFAGVKPGDVAVDLVPGIGYYTRILSKIVGPKGKVYAMVHLPESPVQVRTQDRIREKRGDNYADPVDAVLALQNLTDYSNVTVLWESLTAFGGQFSVPEQADFVWSADIYHDLHNDDFVKTKLDFVPQDPARPPSHLDMATFDKQIFASLKPGGVFAVMDNAATKGAGFTQTETLHRSDEDAVKAEVLAAGFVLDGESRALVNAADDHRQAVHDATLIRTELDEIRPGDVEFADKSDHFLLRFKKPASASAATKRPPAGVMKGYYGNTIRGQAGTNDERHLFYHEDDTYQEFGNSGTLVQEGTYYWDAAGHNCMIHQFPIPERQGIVCHGTAINVKAGDSWNQDNGNGPVPFALIPGYHPLPH